MEEKKEEKKEPGFEWVSRSEIKTVIKSMKPELSQLALKKLMIKLRLYEVKDNRSWLWHFFHFIRHKSFLTRKDFEDNNLIHESIYPAKGQHVGAYKKKFHVIHYIFKYKFFVPLLVIAGRILKNQMETEVEDTWYNKNLRIFDKSWKQTMEILSKTYNKDMQVHPSYDTVRKLALTLVLNDSATREFMNVFLHSVAVNMQNQYKGHKKVYHVYYTGKTSYEPIYFSLVKMVMEENKNPEEVLKSKGLNPVVSTVKVPGSNQSDVPTKTKESTNVATAEPPCSPATAIQLGLK